MTRRDGLTESESKATAQGTPGINALETTLDLSRCPRSVVLVVLGLPEPLQKAQGEGVQDNGRWSG